MQSEVSESAELMRSLSFPSLSNSLRWRQLLTSLIIIATGISGAGAAYYSYQANASLKTQGAIMAKNGRDILVSISHHKELELFVIDNEVISDTEFESFLKKNNFSSGEIERDFEYFGYIQSVKSGAIAWSTKHAFEKPINNESPYATLKNRDHPIFNVTAKVGINPLSTEIIAPNIRKGRNPNASHREKESEYIVHAFGFTFTGKTYQLVLAKSATKIKETKELLKQDIIWLVLLTSILVLLSQLVGSYIVLSPIRRIENEIKLIEAGEKQLIEHEYPNELNPVKSAINTLINAEKGQKRRYREALDNLAHALKTPLAALQGASERATDGELINQEYVDDQIQ